MNGHEGDVSGARSKVDEISVHDVARRDAQVRVVDVREPDEFHAELGHIAGAELVPLASVEAAAKGWRREDPMIMVCRSGRRSLQAAELLIGLGFGGVKNMRGGMLEWNAAHLPAERDS